MSPPDPTQLITFEERLRMLPTDRAALERAMAALAESTTVALWLARGSSVP